MMNSPLALARTTWYSRIGIRVTILDSGGAMRPNPEATSTAKA